MTHPDGPAIPDTYTAHDDVNPICGHHRRANCTGCGSCTTCDSCYCGEDGGGDTFAPEEYDGVINEFDW